MDIEEAFAAAGKVIETLATPETVEKLAIIFAETDETKALALIASYEAQLTVDLGAEPAALLAGRIRTGWTTLHHTAGQG